MYVDTQNERRFKLLLDLHEWENIELPRKFVLEQMFKGVLLSEWCLENEVTYAINREPDDEWRDYPTYIFRYIDKSKRGDKI